MIRLEKPLRVRPQAALELTVRASDLGTPIPLSTLGTVTVSVVGLEDYLPVFLSTEHSVQVPEDAQRGTEVLQLATLTRPGAETPGRISINIQTLIIPPLLDLLPDFPSEVDTMVHSQIPFRMEASLSSATG